MGGLLSPGPEATESWYKKPEILIPIILGIIGVAVSVVALF